MVETKFDYPNLGLQVLEHIYKETKDELGKVCHVGSVFDRYGMNHPPHIEIVMMQLLSENMIGELVKPPKGRTAASLTIYGLRAIRSNVLEELIDDVLDELASSNEPRSLMNILQFSDKQLMFAKGFAEYMERLQLIQINGYADNDILVSITPTGRERHLRNNDGGFRNAGES